MSGGHYFIECDIDGRGKQWRLARVREMAGLGGSYFVATFDDAEFDESLDVFVENGSRIVGPFTTVQMLLCVEIAEYVAISDPGFLPQKKPGEIPITATRANGLAHAAQKFLASDPAWKRTNFAGDA